MVFLLADALLSTEIEVHCQVSIFGRSVECTATSVSSRAGRANTHPYSAVLLVDLVSSLVISFICSTGKEIVPVVGVLELVVRIDV